MVAGLYANAAVPNIIRGVLLAVLARSFVNINGV
jgi:hypothetical protein